jgi:glycosyltransferase involved in cell wall biosynthesis
MRAPVIGYVPFDAGTASEEACWVRDWFACEVVIPPGLPRLNGSATVASTSLAQTRDLVRDLLAADWLIAEGPAGLVWTATLRRFGFKGGATILPYLNPRRWQDVSGAAVYDRFKDPRDRVYVGSTPSARIYHRLGIRAEIGEPFGIDDRRFRLRPHAADVLRRLDIPPGRLLLFVGRAQPDKDLYRLLRTALKARILFPDLRIAIASHVIEESYVAPLRRELGPASGVHLIERPGSEDLADLYCVADLFVTAATSHFETFGRAPAEALASGTPVVAPRYDGFAEVLAQPGGSLVGVAMDEAGPHVREDELLRSVFDVLSASDRPPAAQVSEAAHRRFARSRTIELLAHVVGSSDAPPIDLGDASPIVLPDAWEEELRRLAALPAGAALDRVWNGHHTPDDPADAKLSVGNGRFVDAVRRALCVAAPAPPSWRSGEGSDGAA